ncbi:helix-turn-helix domain-containing protein [Embleya sp. MST-111070]|uniref:helix-turn-helix domain-containing protein n=1 Tax=Embleya sp. MST-111070 TaxID=3398231 RepID=UPI003F739B28
MPDGVVRVMIGFGEPVRVVDAIDPRRAVSGTSMVTGGCTKTVIGEHTGVLAGVTVLLTPLAAYRICGLPMAEWVDRPLDPVHLLGTRERHFDERLAECPDWSGRFGLVEDLLAARLRDGPLCCPEVVDTWRELLRVDGRARVDELADAAGWSVRRLERRFREQIGTSPKTMAQVLRLRAALRRHDAGLSWTEAATETGYHDQPHFVRTFKGLIGCTPGRFRSDQEVRRSVGEAGWVDS